jgi:hypothetical protein
VVARSTGPKRPNCEFRVLLRRFSATARKCTKTSPQTLVRTVLAALPWQRLVSHFRPHPEVFWRNTKWLSFPTHRTPLIWQPVTSSYFQKWIWSRKDAGLIPLRRSRSNRRECLTLWQKRTSGIFWIHSRILVFLCDAVALTIDIPVFRQFGAPCNYQRIYSKISQNTALFQKRIQPETIPQQSFVFRRFWELLNP